MIVPVTFYSYFRELTGCAATSVEIQEGGSLMELIRELQQRFPKLKSMEKSTLMAVGVEYQPGEFILREGDEVSLFPPVQGG
jgi:molybdopterin converting factor small subunit